MGALDRRLLLLDPADNVVVACRDLAGGEEVALEDARVRLAVAVAAGHKLARRPVATGERVVKHGAPIGSATRAIAAGEHVHTHNLRSDYMESTLWAGQRAGATG